MIHDLSSDTREFVSVGEVVAYFERTGIDIPERTIRYHVQKGALAAIKVQGALRIRVDSLRIYLGLPPLPRQSRQQAS